MRFGKEEVMGLYRKYPNKYPWSKAFLATLFGIGILVAGLYRTIVPLVFGSAIGGLLLKVYSVFTRGIGVIEPKYAIALGVLSPIRFVAFFAGNTVGLLFLIKGS